MGEWFGSVRLDDLQGWDTLPAGTVIDKGAQLFPRVDRPKETPAPAAPATNKKKAKASEPAADEGLITFDQFKNIELRVAEVVAAEKVAKSDRLLKLTVRAPEERTIVAGIAQFYEPAELIGRRVLIVANLKPAKLMGIPSQGMVLAAKEAQADGTERLVLATVAGPIAAGSRVA